MAISKSRDEKLMIQADQIAEMRETQMNGIDKLPTIEGNRNPKYRIRADEADRYVFVLTTIKHVSTSTKSVNLEQRIIPIHKAEFQRKIDEQYFAIYDDTEVIHDPRINAPKEYELKNKTSQVKLDTPLTKEQPNVQLNERVKALKAKEQELVDKQTELEERESKLKALESAIPESLTKSKQPNP